MTRYISIERFEVGPHFLLLYSNDPLFPMVTSQFYTSFIEKFRQKAKIQSHSFKVQDLDYRIYQPYGSAKELEKPRFYFPINTKTKPTKDFMSKIINILNIEVDPVPLESRRLLSFADYVYPEPDQNNYLGWLEYMRNTPRHEHIVDTSPKGKYGETLKRYNNVR